ncbi:MAG: phage major capsid protein [Verrucomicrobiota bacterium]|jgi:HK97 family phage major capsid protein
MTETTARLFRAAVLESAGIDLETGIVPLAFASESPVLREDAKYGKYLEVLSHGPGDANLGQLNRAGILLADHNEKIGEIGEVVQGSARVDSDRRTRAKVKIHPQATYWRARIARGDFPSVSVGYSQLSLLSKSEAGPDGIPTLRFAWQPHEVSFLHDENLPADNTTGVNRMKNNPLQRAIELLNGDIQHDETDFSDVSLLDAVQNFSDPRGRTREALEHRAHTTDGRVTRSLPFSLFGLPKKSRDMTAGEFPSGGAFVPDAMQDGVPLLFNTSVCRRLGAVFITGLSSNFVKPRVTTSPTAQPLGEVAPVNPSNLLSDSDDIKPCRLSTQVSISKQWLRQTEPGAEAYVRKLVSDAINTQLDYQLLFGQGGQDQPLGIMNTPGVQSTVYGGPATFGALLSQEQALSQSNIPEDSYAWALSPQTRARWKSLPKIPATNYPRFLLEDARAADWPVLSSNQLSGNHQSIMGAWQTLVILIWNSGLDMMLDRVTRAASGECVLTTHLWYNLLLLYPAGFIVSADSANQ